MSIVTLVGWGILQGRADARRAAEVTTANLTKILADNFNSTIQQIDLGLLTIADEVLRQQKSGSWDEVAIKETIARQDARHPHTIGFRIFGPNGKLRYGIRNIADPRSDISQRDDFIYFKGAPDAGLQVGPAQLGPTAKKWTIPVSRRISNPDGSFGGAVVCPIATQFFTESYAKLDLGPQGSVGLAHTSFELAARFPEQKRPDDPAFSSKVVAKFRDAITSGVPISQYDYFSTVDGIRRLGTVRRIEGQPYYILVGLAEDDYLAQWRRNSAKLLLFGILAVALVLTGMLILHRRISESEAVKEAIKNSEARYRLLAENVSDVIWVLDIEARRFTYISPSVQQLRGFTAEEVMAQPLEAALTPDSANKVAESLRANLAKIAAKDFTHLSGVMEVDQPHRDGRTIHTEVITRYLLDEDGKTISILGVTRDISARKQAEEQHAQLEAQLRESQKMEALGTLAGGVAHDFNNALATILGNVELARQDVGANSSALVSLEEIGKASRRAKNLVQQILAFGRRQPLDRKPMSLALAVAETARLIRTTMPAGATLKVDCDVNTPVVSADATQVEQILINLCNNALQALKKQEQPGIVEICLADHLQTEQRGNRSPGRYACLTVRDNGPGMDETVRLHMFEPFFTTRPKGEGTGLGLSVVHGIVQAHGASIEVDSAVGKGSEFRIYFPAIDTPVAEVMLPVLASKSAYVAKKRVLYVDDEDAIIFLMTRLLERQGFRVSGYTDPREAVATVRANPDQFDLVVTDYSMPGMSGLAVATAIREIRADLPVILASGYITEELRQEAPSAGVRELIYKPNTVDDLCEAVASYANAKIKVAS